MFDIFSDFFLFLNFVLFSISFNIHSSLNFFPFFVFLFCTATVKAPTWKLKRSASIFQDGQVWHTRIIRWHAFWRVTLWDYFNTIFNLKFVFLSFSLSLRFLSVQAHFLSFMSLSSCLGLLKANMWTLKQTCSFYHTAGTFLSCFRSSTNLV